MAGGGGRRVSNSDKGLLKYRGKTLVESQITWLKPQVTELLISANRNIPQYSSLGFSVFSDNSNSFLGPLQGVCIGLEKSTTEWMFVQPVDLPSLPNNAIHLLSNKINEMQSNEQLTCYYFKTDEREHYLSMLIAKSTLTKLKQFLASNRKRVRDFHRYIKSVPLNVGLGEEFFINLNHSSDFK